MPKKIRELKNMLLKAGFICKGMKGSHSKWIHAKLAEAVIISGKDGSIRKNWSAMLLNCSEKQKKEGHNEAFDSYPVV